MGVIYLADTNIISELMRPFPDENVQAAWHTYYHQVAISSVSWHELLYGTTRLPHSKRKTAFENFLRDYLEKILMILPYDQPSTEWHAQERARLMKIGKTPSFADGQIAAIAATNDLVLVTRNVNDFSNFDSLQVENWFTKSDL